MDRLFVWFLLIAANLLPLLYFGVKLQHQPPPSLTVAAETPVTQRDYIGDLQKALDEYQQQNSNLTNQLHQNLQQGATQVGGLLGHGQFGGANIGGVQQVLQRTANQTSMIQSQQLSLNAELQKQTIEAKAAQQKEEVAERDRIRQTQQQVANDLQQQRRENVKLALEVVGVIFALTCGVLYFLSFFGPLNAQVKAVIKQFGGKIWITAAGIVGAFLAIAIVAMGGVYLFATMKP